jgi:hypothetical protein
VTLTKEGLHPAVLFSGPPDSDRVGPLELIADDLLRPEGPRNELALVYDGDVVGDFVGRPHTPLERIEGVRPRRGDDDEEQHDRRH